jgi:hypothetical protein
MNQGLCPKCDRLITHVEVADVTINVSLHPRWKGFSYACPHCNTVLGIEMNPLTIREDIQNHVDGRLQTLRNEIRNDIHFSASISTRV